MHSSKSSKGNRMPNISSTIVRLETREALGEITAFCDKHLGH